MRKPTAEGLLKVIRINESIRNTAVAAAHTAG